MRIAKYAGLIIKASSDAGEIIEFPAKWFAKITLILFSQQLKFKLQSLFDLKIATLLKSKGTFSFSFPKIIRHH